MATKIEYQDENYIAVLHDGNITWDELWQIKNEIWGDDAEAIECYPSVKRTINNVNQRHLFRVKPGTMMPDLLEGSVEI
jgi:hypothetical protein